MKIEVPFSVFKIIKKFEAENLEIYIVGGAVRDVIMGKAVYDWDFTTNAYPEQILKLFENAYYTNVYGMVGIPSEVEGERPFEITTFRTEDGYSDSRRPDKVEWGKTLEEDLARRDFTINAMAVKLVISGKWMVDSENSEHRTLNTDHKFITAEAELIDIYDGQKDIKNKLIRTVGDPNERFSEDALRLMRAVRIAAEIGFSIEEKTLNAIKTNAALINKISRERIREELFKLLKSRYPDEGILILRNSGLLQEIFPELEKAFGVEQKSPGRHHVYDVGTHLVMSLKYVSQRNNNPIVRFASLIHDIGKPLTYKKLATGTITFYNHEMVSAKIAKRIAERLRFSNDEAEKLYKLVRYHQFTVDEKQTDSAIRRFIRKVGLDNIQDMLDLRVGDRLGGGARETSWRLEEFKKRLVEVQKQPFRVQDLKISGYDVMQILKIPSGPQVGKVLENLFNDVVEKKVENERETLLGRLHEHVENN